MTEPTSPRGTPPNQKQLARDLGPRLALWDGAVEMVKQFGATWRWAHSEATGSWSYRAYLPGDRFFVSLSLPEGRLEASLNLKADEWDAVTGEGADERARLAELQARATDSGEDPAWIHFVLTDEACLPVLAKLLFARARRVQAPRAKKRRFR